MRDPFYKENILKIKEYCLINGIPYKDKYITRFGYIDPSEFSLENIDLSPESIFYKNVAHQIQIQDTQSAESQRRIAYESPNEGYWKFSDIVAVIVIPKWNMTIMPIHDLLHWNTSSITKMADHGIGKICW